MYLRIENEFKLRQERNMSSRRGFIPCPWERERVAAARVRVVGKIGRKFYIDFAPDGGAGRLQRPATALRLGIFCGR